MIVIDTNVLAYALIQGVRTPEALKVFQRDPQWVLPALWQHEFLNVLSVHYRAGGLTRAHATQLWNQALHLFAERERPIMMEAALDIALTHRVTTYDAEFIALAQQLNIPCVTEDRALLRAFPMIAISIANFLKA